MFWVFIFPVLLAAGLGIAFRNRPADRVRWRWCRAAAGRLARRPARRGRRAQGSGRLDRLRRRTGAPHRRRRAGRRPDGPRRRVPLRRHAPGAREARSGRTRRCSAPPGARPGAGDRAHGQRAGLALHRLRGARPARHEPHGQRHLGDGLRDRGCAAEAICSSAWWRRRCRGRSSLLSFCSRRLMFLIVEVAAAARLRGARLRRSPCVAPCCCLVASAVLLGALAFARHRAAHRLAAATIEGVSG